MPTAEKKQKKLAWKSDSVEGAFLFLLFHRRICGDPDDFSASETQQNPLYSFDGCSANTFKRSAQTIANRVKKFEEKGTGLTKPFKELIKQAMEKYSNLFEQEGKEDEDHQDEGEEDLSHMSKGEDEESLSDPLQDPRFDQVNNEQPPLESVNILSTSRRSQTAKLCKKAAPKKEAAKTKTDTTNPTHSKGNRSMTVQNNVPGVKSLIKHCDGRVCGRMMLSSDFSDETKFCVAKCGTKVIKKSPKPGTDHPMVNAEVCFQRHGFAPDNIHLIANKPGLKGKKVVNDTTKEFVEDVIFELDTKHKPYFLDAVGSRRDKVYIADNRDRDPDDPTEWMYFWLIDASLDEEEIVAASIDRSKKRRNNQQSKLEAQMAKLIGEMNKMQMDANNGNKVVAELSKENETLKKKLSAMAPSGNGSGMDET